MASVNKPGVEARTMDEARRLDGFALLMPVYDGDSATFLQLAYVSSVLNQNLKPSELIIVQDGPVGEELMSEIQKIRRESPVPVNFVQLEKNQGLGAALNVGLMASSYEVVARMDADDYSLPERFEREWALMESGYDLVGSGMQEFESDPLEPGATRVPPQGTVRIRDHARTHNPFNHPTVMYRVSAVEKAGAYEPFGRMEDYWLWVRMLATGARAENLAEPLVRYRVGSGAYDRRGGFSEAVTEWRLQWRLLRLGFVSFGEYLRNVVMKGAYRLLPASIKQRLFNRLIAGGLPGDRD